MGLALQSHDLPHLRAVQQAPENSLPFLMEGFQAHSHMSAGKSGLDLEAWINALHRQDRPLVASTQGGANLEAWLALVE